MARTKEKAASRTGESAVAEGAAEYLGICSTCNVAPHCAHRIRNPGVAIWYCENYDDHVEISSTELNGGLSEILPVPPKSHRAEFDAIEYKGLCVNCRKRDECNFSQPTGGVWHCEEYE